MRHRKNTRKLGRTSSHREAMLANMVCSLIAEKRITTTHAKAKAARTMAEKMVTLGKKGDLASRRRVISELQATVEGKKPAVRELFDTIGPGFADREGGYTRIMKLGRRSSDSSEMAILEFVEFGPVAKKKKKAAKKPAAKKATTPAEEKVEEPTAEEAPAEEVVSEAAEEKSE